MNKKKIPILSIALYVISGMLVFYMIWSVYHSIGYISGMVAQGQLTISGNEYDIVNFYMSNCAQYLLFAVILFTLGWILQKLPFYRSGNFEKNNTTAPYVEVSKAVEAKEDFEDWFKNNQN